MSAVIRVSRSDEPVTGGISLGAEIKATEHGENPADERISAQIGIRYSNAKLSDLADGPTQLFQLHLDGALGQGFVRERDDSTRNEASASFDARIGGGLGTNIESAPNLYGNVEGEAKGTMDGVRFSRPLDPNQSELILRAVAEAGLLIKGGSMKDGAGVTLAPLAGIQTVDLKDGSMLVGGRIRMLHGLAHGPRVEGRPAFRCDGDERDGARDEREGDPRPLIQSPSKASRMNAV